MKDRLWDIISSGLPRDHELEVLRKILLCNLIILAGIVFLTGFTIVAYFQREYVLFAVDAAVTVFLVGVHLYLRKSKNADRLSRLGILGTGCFYAFLIAHGGVNGSAYVWAFTYPLISLFLVGSVLGTIATFLLLGVASVIFAIGPDFPAVNVYDGNLVARFVAAYVTVYLFALVIERVRVMVQSRLSEANQKLEILIEQKQTLIQDLERTMDEVSTLQGILPICSNCKNVRNDEGYWEQVEEYVRDRSRADFSHSICPDCFKKLYPGMEMKT